MKSIKSIFLALIVTLSFSLHAQQKFLGKVMDANSKPISEVKVFIDGKPTDIVTNARGYFEVDLPEKTMVISVLSKKYGLLSAEYKAQKALSFMYANDAYQSKTTSSDDSDANKVSIGYSSVDKKNTAFITTETEFSQKDDTQAFRTIYDLMRSRLKGVRVTNNKIFIRGVSSLTGATDPLFVVNGQVVKDISYIQPVEVKKINVLKGASATIYGTRGANGVIEITLKS